MMVALRDEAAVKARQRATEDLFEAVLEALQERLSMGTSQTELGKRLGFSTGSYISQIVARKVRPAAATLEKMAAALGVLGGWRMVKSANSNAIMDLCADAQINMRLLMVYGSTGLGKTSALEVYSQKHTKVGYVLCTCYMSERDLLDRIGQALGIKLTGVMSNKLKHLITWLQQNPQTLIILDDFGKLCNRPQLLVQVIRDEMRERVGIVLAGTREMKDRLSRKVDLGVPGFAELQSRIAYCLGLEQPSRDVVREICLHNGINDASAIKHIQNRASDYRQVRELIINAKRVQAALAAEEVTAKMLEEAAVTTKWK